MPALSQVFPDFHVITVTTFATSGTMMTAKGACRQQQGREHSPGIQSLAIAGN